MFLLPQKCLSSQVVLQKTRPWKSGRNLSWAEEITSITTKPMVAWRLNHSPWQWPKIHEQWHYHFRPHQGKRWPKNHKDLHGERTTKRTVREGRRNGKNILDPTSWELTVYLSVGYFSSQSIWFWGLLSLYRTRCQMKASCKTWTQGSTSCSLMALLAIESSW